MTKGNDLKEFEKTATHLGKKTSFKGKMRFSESVMISGTFEGEIESGGHLYVEEGATVRANIKVRTIVIGGVIHGNIEASDMLEMLPTGQVFGNVRTGKLRIADGVTFEGKCEMIRNGETVDIFSAPVDQLKKSMQGIVSGG